MLRQKLDLEVLKSRNQPPFCANPVEIKKGLQTYCLQPFDFECGSRGVRTPDPLLVRQML